MAPRGRTWTDERRLGVAVESPCAGGHGSRTKRFRSARLSRAPSAAGPEFEARSGPSRHSRAENERKRGENGRIRAGQQPAVGPLGSPVLPLRLPIRGFDARKRRESGQSPRIAYPRWSVGDGQVPREHLRGVIPPIGGVSFAPRPAWPAPRFGRASWVPKTQLVVCSGRLPAPAWPAPRPPRRARHVGP